MCVKLAVTNFHWQFIYIIIYTFKYVCVYNLPSFRFGFVLNIYTLSIEINHNQLHLLILQICVVVFIFCSFYACFSLIFLFLVFTLKKIQRICESAFVCNLFVMLEGFFGFFFHSFPYNIEMLFDERNIFFCKTSNTYVYI